MTGLTTMLLLGAGGGLIGFLLAVLGAGGSILLMPLLTIGAGLNTDTAISLSLLVVIVLAIGNAIPSLRRRQVAFKPAVILGLPALAGSWIGGTVAKGDIVSDAMQLGIFASVAGVVAWLLLRRSAPDNGVTLPLSRQLRQPRSPWPLAFQGLLVGLLTGVAGVGGGFAIVPALVLLAGLPMQLATNTSLLLIALNSLVAVRALGIWPQAQLPLLVPLLAGGCLGAVVGQRLAPSLNELQLRRGFAALLIGSALLIAGKALQTHRALTGKPNALQSLRSPHHDLNIHASAVGGRHHGNA
ncbi:MAG: sulfite exporter TauE/SafE family protein [Cyanobacteriota bacterium]|nr:sulfite exporter TauE/SafE family protein [Cyanobacteriota bacterium]